MKLETVGIYDSSVIIYYVTVSRKLVLYSVSLSTSELAVLHVGTYEIRASSKEVSSHEFRILAKNLLKQILKL